MNRLFPILAVSVLIGISSPRADAAPSHRRTAAPSSSRRPGRHGNSPRFAWKQATEWETGRPLPKGVSVELEIPPGKSRFVEFTPGPQAGGIPHAVRGAGTDGLRLRCGGEVWRTVTQGSSLVTP